MGKEQSIGRKELIKAVATDAQCTQTVAKAVIEAYESALVKSLTADGVVKLGNLGSFHIKAMAAANRRNPRTGEVVVKPAYKKMVFKATPSTKQLFNFN